MKYQNFVKTFAKENPELRGQKLMKHVGKAWSESGFKTTKPTKTTTKTTKTKTSINGGFVGSLVSGVVGNLATDALSKLIGLGVSKKKSISKTIHNKLCKILLDQSNQILSTKKGNGMVQSGGFLPFLASALAPLAIQEGAKLLGLGNKKKTSSAHKNGGLIYRPRKR